MRSRHAKLRTPFQLVLLTALATLQAVPCQTDLREVTTGLPIPDESYCDQPRLVTLSDGSWVCVLTTGRGHEGQGGQHVVATRSTDQGRSWSALVDVEPADPMRPASYAVSYVTPFDRVYAFYTFNGDAIHARPGEDGKPRDERIRADTMGWWCYRYSDDGGRTWSERHRMPMRVTACDRDNDWGGEVQMFWAIGDPVTTTDGAVVFGFTKLRRHFLIDGEGWFWRSDNLATERDPTRLQFELLPDGEHGLRHPDFGSVQEEFNVVPTPGGGLACVYRTTQGFAAIAYSEDGGHRWSVPEPLRRTTTGPLLRNPRACPKLWHLGDDRYLFWFHNHGGRDFKDRNPAWLVAGKFQAGRLEFGQPEVALYGEDRSYATGRFSYPDLIPGGREATDEWFLAETQKTVARIHSLDGTLLAGMFAALEESKVPAETVVTKLLFDSSSPGVHDFPNLPLSPGFSIELVFDYEPLASTRLASSTHFQLALEPGEQGTRLLLRLGSGKHALSWRTDPLPDSSAANRPTLHAIVTLDGGPRLVTAIVDGQLDDGLAPDGTAIRQRGFGWYDPQLGKDDDGSIPGGSMRQMPELRRLRVHDRPLRTYEAAALSAPR